MSVFDAPDFDHHEEVVFIDEPACGLRAIIAVHNTHLGPALGGCRMWPYETQAAALRDVLRLSRGMTYKAAMARVKLGGGKSVMIGDAYSQKTPDLLHAMGRAIGKLGGRYITGEDIGTNPLDMKEIRETTHCVSCLRKEDGGLGDPAPLTALGVLSAMRAGIARTHGATSFDGVHVALQGTGNVGTNLCRLLAEEGATLTVCDARDENAERAARDFGAERVDVGGIYDVAADVFAPCAMGAVLNDDTIPRLKVKVVAGAANNQLDEDHHGDALRARGIVYLPDYVANGGGLISCAAEWYREGDDAVRAKVIAIRETCDEILDRAECDGVATSVAADRIAEERFGPRGV